MEGVPTIDAEKEEALHRVSKGIIEYGNQGNVQICDGRAFYH
jgi:hypothetical protein